eukprot:RCo011424
MQQRGHQVDPVLGLQQGVVEVPPEPHGHLSHTLVILRVRRHIRGNLRNLLVRRNGGLLGLLDAILVLFIFVPAVAGGEDQPRHQHSACGDPCNLSPKQLPLQPGERGVSPHRSLQIPCEVLLDKASGKDPLGLYVRKLGPGSQVIAAGHEVHELVGAGAPSLGLDHGLGLHLVSVQLIIDGLRLLVRLFLGLGSLLLWDTLRVDLPFANQVVLLQAKDFPPETKAGQRLGVKEHLHGDHHAVQLGLQKSHPAPFKQLGFRHDIRHVALVLGLGRLFLFRLTIFIQLGLLLGRHELQDEALGPVSVLLLGDLQHSLSLAIVGGGIRHRGVRHKLSTLQMVRQQLEEVQGLVRLLLQQHRQDVTEVLPQRALLQFYGIHAWWGAPE